MRTVGIDFASKPVNTALCEIVWNGITAVVEEIAVIVTDARIRELLSSSTHRIVGVDIPFGWPTRFVQFVSAHTAGASPPPDAKSGEKRLRETDMFIWKQFKKVPLSVSTDKIGIPAMRWAALSHEFGIVNRAGDGRFFEVYPAAARLAWALPKNDKDNKDKGDTEALNLVLDQCPLEFSSLKHHNTLLSSEHAFDALICSLTTRAAALGLTYPPPADLQGVAQVEGWIHAPRNGTLDQLISADVD